MTDAADPMARTGESAASAGHSRVLAIDAARALAIIGMVSVNVGPKDSADAGAWFYLLPHGRASILFVLLAGIGFSLMTRRLRAAPRGTGLGPLWAALGWRCGVLLVGGLALQLLDHEANVILAVYALLFVVSGALVRARDAALLAVTGLGLALGPVLWLWPQVQAGMSFDGRAPRLDDPPGEVLASVLLTGPYPLVTWVAPFTLGMWLGRRDLGAVTTRRRTVLAAAALAVGAPLLARTLTWARGGQVGDLSWELLLTDAPHGQMPLWLVGATAVSVLVLAGCLAVEQRFGGRLLRPLVPLGQLSLTFYVVHLVVLAGLRPLPQTLGQGVLICVLMVAVAGVAAWLWRRHYRRGPLEVAARPPWTWRTS